MKNFHWRTSFSDVEIIQRNQPPGPDSSESPLKLLEKKLLLARWMTGLGRFDTSQKKGYVALGVKTKSAVFVKSGSIYTRSSWISLARKYDICYLKCLMSSRKWKLLCEWILPRVNRQARELSGARTVKRACWKRAQRSACTPAILPQYDTSHNLEETAILFY